ncbi:hypothetical protein [Hymenobacter sp. B81]|uniref:hypothetical protein n=1 Tax=Hymenobacter sp. B81 TaxID=3344878 RepID=UPI0037DC0075
MSYALAFVAEIERNFSATPLFIGSGLADLNKEAVSNQHSIAFTTQQAQQLTIQDLRQMILGIVAAKHEQLRTQSGLVYPMQFYCWHDKQAAQLRFSIVSAAAAALPFRCQVRLTPDLDDILSSFLGSGYHDGIPWNELLTGPSTGDEPTDDSSGSCLEVWKTLL